MKTLSRLCTAFLLFLPISSHAQVPAVADRANTDPAQIVKSTTYDLGDRFVTVQEVTPTILPTPQPTSPEKPPAASHKETQSASETGPRDLQFSIGATVYRENGKPTRTQLQINQAGTVGMIEVWSSIDWQLLANESGIILADGTNCSFLMLPGVETLEQGQTPADGVVIPAFPSGKASYQFIGRAGNPDTVAFLEACHALHDREFAKLHAAVQQREMARLQQDAELRAHPPKPEDMIIQYRLLAPGEMDKK